MSKSFIRRSALFMPLRCVFLVTLPMAIAKTNTNNDLGLGSSQFDQAFVLIKAVRIKLVEIGEAHGPSVGHLLQFPHEIFAF